MGSSARSATSRRECFIGLFYGDFASVEDIVSGLQARSLLEDASAAEVK